MKTLPATSVSFQTDDLSMQKLYDAAQRKLRDNVWDYGGRPVMIDGAGYNKIYLETQPMGGEMYAKRNMEVALNNQLLFMEYQRDDGRIPGSIFVENGKMVPQFNKIQGFFLADSALNMYYWMGRDEAYLRRLADCLQRFDAYLWRVRDSNGDGCLESWCMTDTGEDYALRYGDAPFWWEPETPPRGYNVVPMASMDFMSYSVSCRNTLSKISTILNDGRAEYWKDQAQAVADKIREYLWDDARGACFDRDNRGRTMPTLVHNNLRCMYFGSFSQEMADRFVTEHLCNRDEFWTPMPLPSVALNDPLFRNIPTNDWSGQPQALTYQRAIRALENYGYEKLLPELGRHLFNAIGPEFRFGQQFDVYTGRLACEPGDEATNGYGIDGYGATMLSILEYISRLHGIHLQGEEIWWGVVGGPATEYTQRWGEHVYTLRCDGKKAVGIHNARTVFELKAGQRAVTDYNEKLLRTISL